MNVKEALNEIHFNDIYKEVKNRKLKKKVLNLQELYANLKNAYVLNMNIKVEKDSDAVEGVIIIKNNESLNQLDDLTLNELASIEIDETMDKKKIIVKLLNIYTLNGEVFNDKQRTQELNNYKKMNGLMLSF